jgi:hypothetical protein
MPRPVTPCPAQAATPPLPGGAHPADAFAAHFFIFRNRALPGCGQMTM